MIANTIVPKIIELYMIMQMGYSTGVQVRT